MKQLLYLKDDQLKDLIEKLFIGYRETFSDSKKILNKYKIGIAHQKVIHLLSMYEGISISELLKRLKVTKQSLNRVLKDLIKEHVEDAFDHKNLNEQVPEFKNLNPTAENIVVVIHQKLKPHLTSDQELEVTLYETPRNFVSYKG